MSATPYCFDPYEAKRRKARQARQRELARNVTADLPIDGDAREVRRPVTRAGDAMGAVLEALGKDIFKSESRFFDTVREQWPKLFPNSPARPGRWAPPNRLVLYVPTAGQSFALRPKLPAITRRLKALPGAPKERFTVIVQIHA